MIDGLNRSYANCDLFNMEIGLQKEPTIAHIALCSLSRCYLCGGKDVSSEQLPTTRTASLTWWEVSIVRRPPRCRTMQSPRSSAAWADATNKSREVPEPPEPPFLPHLILFTHRTASNEPLHSTMRSNHVKNSNATTQL